MLLMFWGLCPIPWEERPNPIRWVMACCVLQTIDTVGEILLSLSYLPTAERLTVVVVKAKNLVWSNGKGTAGECGASSRPQNSGLDMGACPGISQSSL